MKRDIAEHSERQYIQQKAERRQQRAIVVRYKIRNINLLCIRNIKRKLRLLRSV